MKEASGELNMTLITVVAVALIGALFAALYPSIERAINESWGKGTSAGVTVGGNGNSGGSGGSGGTVSSGGTE